MRWRNQRSHWGLGAVSLHWIVALSVFGLFALGWWMTELGYYDSWYKKGPYIHKSIGIILFLVVALRIFWRRIDRTPDRLASHSRWEQRIARLAHAFQYLLLLVIMISGYLISTADGRAISVFAWFEVPATLQGLEQQEDLAGVVHWFGACILMGLTALHIAGAAKHQFIDKDETITRMLGRLPKTR